jgi:hypothetical protein
MATTMISNLKKLNEVASNSKLVHPIMYITTSVVVCVSVWLRNICADSFG